MIIPRGFPSIPKDFEYETEVHDSLDGEHSIFLNIYRKKGVTPKRVLMIIHGQGEHGGRYQHFPHYLGSIYDLIVAPDLRGHGRSEGIRGHVENFDEYIDDAFLVWDWLKKKVPAEVSKDWLGHSMGGLVSLRCFLYRENLEADHLIISSPLLGLRVPVPAVKVFAARIVNRFWSALQMQTGLDPAKISHDPNVVEAYQQDRLNHSIATPGFFFSMKSAISGLNPQELKIPSRTRILFQVAGSDDIVDPEATKIFFEKLPHPDKKIIVYPEWFHEVYNETGKEQVFADLKEWIENK